jgi:hypothetical protein
MFLGGIEPDAYTHLEVFFLVHQPIRIYGQRLVKWSNFEPNTTLFTDAIADILLAQHGLKQAFTPKNRETHHHKKRQLPVLRKNNACQKFVSRGDLAMTLNQAEPHAGTCLQVYKVLGR